MYIRILKYLKPYWKKLILALLFSIFVALSNIYFAVLAGDVTRALNGKHLRLFTIFILDGIGLFIVRQLFTYLQVYLMSYISSRLTIDLRVELYAHIQKFSLDFFERTRLGDIISRIFNDVNAIEVVIKESMTKLLTQTLTLIGVLCYLLYLNWKLTVACYVFLPLIIFLIQQFAKRVRKISSKIQRKNADITSVLQESLAGIRIVKAFSMESYEIKRFTRENERNFKLSMKNVRVKELQEPVIGLLQFCSILAVFWYSGRLIIMEDLNPADLMSFAAGIMLMAEPVLILSKIYTMFQGAFASAERVFTVLDMVPSVKEAWNAKKLEKLEGEIEFNKVAFYYDKKVGEVLKDISVSIKPGETVALVGPSGAGKTTFVNLIPRFYDVTSGEMMIDGNNVKKLDTYSYRSKIGIVPQETVLFRGSIENNIAYGKVGATRAEIVEAARFANAEEFILKMKHGYATRLGDRGQRLSGGQKQRIAIARAILKNPKILILDEATSSLDSESEKLVQDALDNLMVDRTTIVIAHRLSTVQNADRILVFNDGKIVEEGTHKVLMKKKGLYTKLYENNFRDS